MSQPLIFEVEVDARVASIQIEAPKVTVASSDPRVIFAIAPGPPGEQGPPGEGFQIFGEYLLGAKNGVNKVFETENIFRPTTTAVYVNGLREDIHECYIESSPNMIVFDEAPSSTDKLTIDYIVQ